MKKYLFFLLLLVCSPSQASTPMGLYDIYNLSSVGKKADSTILPDPTRADMWLILHRWKVTALGVTVYFCTVTSLNEWLYQVTVARPPGTAMTSYDFANIPTGNTAGQGRFQWDYFTSQPDTTMNPWCLQ